MFPTEYWPDGLGKLLNNGQKYKKTQITRTIKKMIIADKIVTDLFIKMFLEFIIIPLFILMLCEYIIEHLHIITIKNEYQFLLYGRVGWSRLAGDGGVKLIFFLFYDFINV